MNYTLIHSQKLLSFLLLLAMVANNVAYAADGKIDPAKKTNDPDTVYDLVTLVVDVDLDKDGNSYDGLKNDYPEYNGQLSDTQLGHRILRYAEDVRKNNDLTDVKILFYDKKKDSVNGLATALENLYRNGDGSHENRLAGVVLIGDIPLPVVNKNGNRYISMFPYTDFVDKAYLYNSKSDGFEKNAAVGFPKPEIWHGVIRAPTGDFAGREQLAEFFDKNHLYYEGVPMFSKFERKMFFGDLVHEEEGVNPDSYKQYLKYWNALEDLAYFRYNKYWASELTNQVTSVLSEIPEEIKPKGDNGKFLASLQGSNPLANIPDVYTKSIIDQSLLPYYQVLSKYIGKVNDWSDYTARYAKKADGRLSVDSVAGLIAVKDEYTKYYLKSVNEALEKKLNEIAEKIQEPIDLVDFAQMTGEVDGDEFEIEVDDKVENALPLPLEVPGQIFRFNYHNEQDGKWYINGVDANILQSPKQCMPLLGSTKTEYFDENLNFNPKAIGGEYSVLTRSLRSDNGATAAPLHTVGANTRMLSPVSIGGQPSELFQATGGAYAGNANADGSYDTGAIIEDNPAYGISAFIHNPLVGKLFQYKGIFEQQMQKGDVIVKVNGKNLSFANTFDQAIEESYQAVKVVVDAVKDKKVDQLKNFPYQIKIAPGDSLSGGDLYRMSAYFSVGFYRQDTVTKKYSFITKYFSFTLDKDGNTSASDPAGNPEAYVLLDTPAGVNFNIPEFYDQGTEGAIFTLYKNKSQGYGGETGAYDASGGCNAASAGQNSDRCLGIVAAMPVLDPAGSLAPIIMKIPGLEDKLKFPEKVKQYFDDATKQVKNSDKEFDYVNHVDSYQFPTNYKYEDVDEVYYNACFAGLPSPVVDLKADTNPYSFVLDPNTDGDSNDNLKGLLNVDHDVGLDFYGKLMKSIGQFVNSKLAKEPDYVEGDTPAKSSNYSALLSIWIGLSQLDAGQIVLNDDPKVTLKDFSDHYGLFDGIDNNNDGFTDYKWVDLDSDGVSETKYYDFKEADVQYGIPSSDLQQIARKLLSRNGSYTVPYGIDSFPYKNLDENVTLRVVANNVKKISSVIVHNEPTDYTIAEQMKSQTAFSLPIDNPRYVAFQSVPSLGPKYPDPKPNNVLVDVEGILKKLGDTVNPPVYQGKTQKIKYINLFDEEIRNMAQLQVALFAKANELAAVPGSYRIFGPGAKEGDYTSKEISDEILNNHLLPVVKNTLDNPVSGFNLQKAAEVKVYDALNWLSLNIDEKHEYVLRNYLNGAKNAYVADNTLLPAPAGFEPTFGYEAAYLVLDGEKDYFDMNFNKDIPEEKNNIFDPLSIVVAGGGESGSDAGGGGAGAGGSESSGGETESEYESVWLKDFIKELQKFMKSMKSVPEFTNECFDIESWKIGDEKGAGQGQAPVGGQEAGFGVAVLPLSEAPDPDANEVQINSYVYSEIAGYEDLLEKIKVQEGAALKDDGSGSGGGDSAAGGENGNGGADDGDGNGSVSENGGGGGGGNANAVKNDGGVTGDVTLNKKIQNQLQSQKSKATDKKAVGQINNVSGEDKVDDAIETDDGEGDQAGGNNEIGSKKVENENGQVGDGQTGETGQVGVGEADNSDGDEKDLMILKSTPIEETVPVARDQSEEKVTEESAEESEPVETPAEITPEITPDQRWEEYFIDSKYYEKFLPGPEAKRKRWLAEAFSDNPFVKADKDDYGKYVVENGDGIVADGKSLMKIEAQVFDSAGNVEIKKTHKVKFSVEPNLVSFEGGNVVESKNGAAVIYLRAGKVAGDLRIKAEVLKSDGVSVDKNYQVVTKDLHLLAGEPAQIEIQTDAGILVANNQSKTTLTVILKDKFGNVANNSFSKVAFFVNDIVGLDEKADTNSEIIGVQLDTFEGRASVDLFAKDKVGAVDVVAVVLEPDLEDKLLEAGDDIGDIDFSKYVGISKSYQIVDKVDLILQTFDENFQPVNSVMADGKSIARLGLKLQHNGQLVKSYNGPIKFTVLKENLGNFVSKPPENLVGGELNPANVTFKAGTLTGEEEILVEIPGFASDSFKFKLKANAASKIELIASEKVVDSDAKKQVVLTARLLDKYGNLAEGENGKNISFQASKATSDLVNFSQNQAVSVNGIATVQVSAKNISGVANIVASGEGLEPASISLKINKRVTSEVVETLSPRALYVSLLGGAFGRINDQNNLANALLYSQGQVEALSTVTASKDEHKRLFGVDGYGKINFLTETVEAKVVPATNSFPYQKIVLSENISGDELGNVFVVPKVDTPVLLVDDKTEIPDKEGIFVKILDEAVKDAFSQEDDGIYFKMNSETEFKVDKYGRISIGYDAYELRVPTIDDEVGVGNFSLVVSKGLQDVALISFKQNFNKDVKVLDYGSAQQNFTAGIYVQPVTNKNKYEFVAAYTGSSTSEPQGSYMIDMEEPIDSAQAPGFGFSSLENADKDFGLGFDGSNKHMLLFAAGNSVGNSFVPYASDSGIIYGDPTIKLKVEGDLIGETGYSKDIGKAIFNGQEPIQQLIEFDVNADGYDDLLLVYDGGLIRLLENEISNQRFRDRGYILNIYNGIYSIARIDVNNDGYDDLVVGTKESCNAGEQCISLLKNDHGAFARESLNLALSDKKVYEMKAADMNSDGCEDLVTSDSSGSISIFYNKNDGESCQGLETNYGYGKSFGFTINSEINQVENIFVNYPGMELPDDGKSQNSNWYKFIQFNLPSSQPAAPSPQEAPGFSSAEINKDATDFQNLVENNTQIATKDAPAQTFNKKFDFIHIKQDGKFALNSTKQNKDLNGGAIGVGDEIEYLIALKNDSGTDINNLLLSDVTPASMTLLKNSLKCLDVNCSDDLEWLDTGTSLRSGIIKNISVPAGGQRIISYKMTVNVVPKVHFDLGNNFIKYPSNNNDAYLDIMVRPEVNPDGVLTYLYSTGPKSYEKIEVTPADNSKNVVDDTFKKLGLPSPSELLQAGSGLSPEAKMALGKLGTDQNQDKDYNGCPDKWNQALTTSKSGGDAVAAAVEGVLGSLRCSGGGCSPIPYNYAFLVPDGATPGIATFLAGTANPPYFGFFLPSVTPSVFRTYISPTLSLGLGTAACVGPNSAAGMCFAFAVPGGIPGVCGLVKTSMNKAMSAAKNAVVDPALGTAAAITSGDGSGGNKDVDLGGNWGDANDPISAAAKVNIRIPGFPSVLTNWMDGEIDEIYNKLLRFPTFYFIMPDFSRVAAESKLAVKNFSFRNLHDFATSLSNFPFVKIEGKEIVIKVPALSPNLKKKYDRQLKAWLKHMEYELEKFKKWDCDQSEGRNIFCDKVALDMEKIISTVKKTMDALDQIANLPKDILQWRNQEAKYATQIICYLDAIMNYTGGYIKRQQKIVQSWMKTVQDTIRTFKQWKLIMDVVSEYQESCDKCKNDRFSKLGMIMQLFVAMPDIPIIPLPKWPDIVVDFSQIRTGVTILWPDVVFRPEPIILPNLPTIVLPDVLPPNFNPDLDFDSDFGLSGPEWKEFSEFGVELSKINFSKFKLPELPDLPQIPLPQLPDLPKPPKIPTLPPVVVKIMKNLKFAFKILCLIKNGFVPIPETTLETEIETLTQPSVQAVLPIIKNFGMQWPAIEYSYIEQIRINGKLNFTIDTNFIYNAADKGAAIWNENLSGLVRNLNKLLAIPYGQAINKLLQKSVDKVYSKPSSYVPEAVPEIADLGEIETLKKNMQEIKAEMEDYVAQINKENVPDAYYLTASQNFLDKTDPILNRSLAEIENNLKYEDLPDTPGMRQMAALRNEMIAYTKGLNSSNDLLEQLQDIDEFNKILVDSDQSLSRVAAIPSETDVGGDLDENVAGETLEFSFFGDEMENTIIEAAKDADLPAKRDLIAAAIDFNPQEMADAANQATPPPIGFFVGAGDVSENVLNYTNELKGKTNILFSDVDHDADYDIVYSMGGDIYLKSNYKKTPDLPKGDLIVGFTNNAVGDFDIDGGSAVQGISVPYIGTGKVDISWLPVEGAVAYEIILKKSIYDKDPVYTYNVNVAELSDKNAPKISKDIPNGNYYVSVLAINVDGKKSLMSDTTIVAPQSCADSEPPMPIVSSTDYTVSIFKDVPIDASGSIDADGEVNQYYLETLPYDTDKTDPITKAKLKTTQLNKILWSDTNVLFDTDGDGLAWNDKTNSKFTIGPFVNEGDIGKHEFLLHVVDQSGKDASIKLAVNVVAPEITLEQSFATSAVAEGETKPLTSNLPFWLMRNRYIYRVIKGQLKVAPRIDKVKEAMTEESGKYSISDFKLEDMILVENANGEIVAEINPKTGDIGGLKAGYKTVVNPASPPNSPTSVSIVDKNNQVLGTVFVVADANSDVYIHQQLGLNAESIKGLIGVNIDDLDANDNFAFEKLPADDPGNPGGVVMKHKVENKILASVDSAGNIVVTDQRINLSQKLNNHENDPLILQINFEGKAAAEVYIEIAKPALVIGPKDVPFSSPNKPSEGVLNGSVSNKNLPSDMDFIIDQNFKFSAEQLVRRKDFVRILLKMICVVPSDEAKLPFKNGAGYHDNNSFGEYHPDIKEATMLKLIEGYKGEPDEQGLFPFKAENNITRAEAVKIILKALEYRGVVDTSKMKEGEIWYADYMKAGQNLTPYLKSNKPIKNNFIITSEEAADPYKIMSFGELLTMVQRVLDTYNCFEEDANNNGMSDFCEAKYKVSEPNADEDQDGLSNAFECSNKMDPTDDDIDDGGVKDGKEIQLKTNVFDPADDALDEDNDGLSNIAETSIYHTDPYNSDTDGGGKNDGKEVKDCGNPLDPGDDNEVLSCKNDSVPGLYIVPSECNTCPCISTFLHRAEIIPGDIFFPVVGAYYQQYYDAKPKDKTYIFSKGNEVQVQTLNK